MKHQISAKLSQWTIKNQPIMAEVFVYGAYSQIANCLTREFLLRIIKPNLC